MSDNETQGLNKSPQLTMATTASSHRIIGGPAPSDNNDDIHESDTTVNTQSRIKPANNRGNFSSSLNGNNGGGASSVKAIVAQYVSSTFGFNRLPFSLVFVLVYVTFILILSTIQASARPYVPAVYPQKYIEKSWSDLQVISKDYHPYGSHANDEVHNYILNEIQAIIQSDDNYDNIILDYEPRRIMFAKGDVFDKSAPTGKLTYYESNNILVKIPGSDPTLKAVLLSAHFDSVPTGHGTTDDGVGIASLLGVLHYLADNKQTKRSIIFNFNNNEEFGLLGAEAFVLHPWFHEVESFLNLEGAGSGGRPVLFRTTDYGVAKHYSAASAPHGNSIPQQAFDLGLIHSETDFSVYKQNGLRGLDVSFYKPRSLYHTRRDSISHMSLESVSHMLTNAIDVTISLANADSYGGDDEAEAGDVPLAVFFDILGVFFVVLPLTTVLAINITGLIVGPILVILLWTAVNKRHSWTIRAGAGWYRGIFAILISVAVTYGVVKLLFENNPFVIASQLYPSLLSSFALFLITSYTILGLTDYFWPVHDQKLVIFIELLTMWWVFLLYATIQVAHNNASGLYLATILYYLGLVAVIIGLLGHLIIPDSLTVRYDESSDDIENSVGIEDEDEDEGTGDDIEANVAGGDGEAVDDDEPNENTSLLAGNRNDANNRHGQGRDRRRRVDYVDFVTVKPLSLSFDWLLQFLTVVPIGLYIVYSVAILMLDMLHQSLDDSNENVKVLHLQLVVFSFLLSALVLPFVHRLHFIVVVILATVAVIGGISSFTSFPFTHDNPHKLKFKQVIDLDDCTGTSSCPAVANIFDTSSYTQQILNDLPSVKSSGNIVSCKAGTLGSTTCTYDGLRPWIINNSSDYNEWLHVEVVNGRSETRGPNKGELYINAPDVRHCTLGFNTSTFRSNHPYSDGRSHVSPVRTVTVYHDTKNTTVNAMGTDVNILGWESSDSEDVFKYPFGIDDVTLHKLDWADPGFHIGIEWIPVFLDDDYDNDLGVQVTCNWGEYDQQVIPDDNNLPLQRKIPALDEVLQYSPLWTSWANWGPGLVQVTKYVDL